MNTASEPVSTPFFAAWETPQCPFRIEFPAAMLEEIRSAVVDAFYSVPRGGVEIGGILLGKYERGCVRIEAWRQIPCEYALGPSFTLSAKDQAALAELLAGAKLEAVGWFHSHTRSDIRLSPADLEICDKFFPGNRQVALVLRPAHLQSTRAGFFFREEDGSIQSEASYHEFLVDAASMERMAARELPAAVESVPVKRPRRGWTWIPALLFAGFAAAGAFATRSYWCPTDSVPPVEMKISPVGLDIQLAAEKRIVEELEREAQVPRADLLDQQLRNKRLERSVRALRQRLLEEQNPR